MRGTIRGFLLESGNFQPIDFLKIEKLRGGKLLSQWQFRMASGMEKNRIRHQQHELRAVDIRLWLNQETRFGKRILHSPAKSWSVPVLSCFQKGEEIPEAKPLRLSLY